MSKIRYNTHTHIFTIDHVPNKFGKKLMPLGFHHILTMKAIKWYYSNFTSRGNYNFKVFMNKVNTIRYLWIDFMKWTIVLNWINRLFFLLLRWLLSILFNFTRLDFIFSRSTRESFKRFLMLGRYSLYKSQDKIFDLLSKSYDSNMRFVVLAMDMDYMEGGKPQIPYMDQLEDLKRIKQRKKDKILPFLFLDPRRVYETKYKSKHNNYTNYSKHLLSSGTFSGIKMYPALGYYPFDRELIDMYIFAQEYQIPIITHCIEGTVFYRGNKKPEWNEHPILKYNRQGGKMEPIPLPQEDNYRFTTNFTHPLNYHCLLNQKLLKEYLGDEAPDLSQLKICLAHFGGEEEWKKYLADGWNNYNKNICHDTKEEYLKRKNTLNHGNPRTIWWNASWLSIIYDLMVEYENVYADISFILHEKELFPLLKFLLNDIKVKHKILFGSDYYVVSQKKTEKDLYLNLRGYLGEEFFDLIAHDNPKRFLSSKCKTY